MRINLEIFTHFLHKKSENPYNDKAYTDFYTPTTGINKRLQLVVEVFLCILVDYSHQIDPVVSSF